jgi:shikimate 5-dehydrogenase
MVIDLAYGPRPTPLVTAVLARGGAVVDGYDVLLTQVRKQFQLLTGLEMPAVIGRQVVLDGNAAHFRSAGSLLQTAQGMAEACECSS